MASVSGAEERYPLLGNRDQNGNQPNLPNSWRLTRCWPRVMWLIMKILGTFYHKKVVADRRCFTCEMDHFGRVSVSSKNSEGISSCERRLNSDKLYNLTISYESDHGEVQVENTWSGYTIPSVKLNPKTRQSQSEGKDCKACQACWWDKRGQVQYYTEESIGVAHWNHVGSWFISTIILFAIIGLIIIEIVHTIDQMFGKRALLLHLLSYSCFLCSLAVYPVMSLCSKLRSALCGRGPGIWATSLNVRFIIRRLQYLDLQNSGAPGKLLLTACFIWPIICAIYRSYVVLVVGKKDDTRRYLACFTAGSSMLIWGCFMYLMYAMRVSFQIQLDLILKFFKKFEGHTDLCQNILRQVTVDFKCFHQCVGIYMTAMIPMCVLAVTTNLTWQYMSNSEQTKDHVSANPIFQRNINVMIWLEISMFVILGPVAIGGVDVNYIWERFHTNIYCMMGGEHQFFWEEITRYLRNVEGKTPVISFTMILSIVGFYMAVQFGQQDLIY